MRGRGAGVVTGGRVAREAEQLDYIVIEPQLDAQVPKSQLDSEQLVLRLGIARLHGLHLAAELSPARVQERILCAIGAHVRSRLHLCVTHRVTHRICG